MEKPTINFSPYQKLVVALLALTQFTVILDFMVISPLGDLLMKSMDIEPSQFGFAVSAYAFSAGLSGILTAGFADRFDRKKLLVFFYAGFILGTLLCGIVNTYPLLLAARIITGLFGGVIGSISMAIVADLFPIQQRGRVMGFMQMGFAASQVLGIPASLALSNVWGWQSPFWLVVAIAVIVMVVIMVKLQPVKLHLAIQKDKSAIKHLLHTVAKRDYRVGFTATALLAIGGFMMMPFGSAFAVNNLHITQRQLPLLFMVAGVGSLLSMPLIGKLSDKMDKFTLFTIASFYMMAFVVVYTNLGPQALWVVMIFNVLMMAGIFGRMIPSTALATAIPDMQDRGAFMSINASVQQIAGGVAAAVAGLIVVQKDKHSPLQHYNTLGWIIVGISLISIGLMYRVNKMIKARTVSKEKSIVKEEPDAVQSYEL
jgi:predicted MFS family arabinose efflux permease